MHDIDPTTLLRRSRVEGPAAAPPDLDVVVFVFGLLGDPGE